MKVMCLPKYSSVKGRRGRGDDAPRILNFGTMWV